MRAVKQYTTTHNFFFLYWFSCVYSVGHLRQRQVRRGAPARPPTSTRPSGPGDGGRSRAPRPPATRPSHRRPRGRRRGARMRIAGEADRRSARPLRIRSTRLASSGRAASPPGRSSFRSLSPDPALGIANPRPAARRGPGVARAAPAGSRASRRGFARGCARPARRAPTIRAARASTARRWQCTSRSGMCCSASPGSRAANTRPTGSASSRRATNASVRAEVSVRATGRRRRRTAADAAGGPRTSG